MSILNGFKQEVRSELPETRFKMSVLDTVSHFHDCIFHLLKHYNSKISLQTDNYSAGEKSKQNHSYFKLDSSPFVDAASAQVLTQCPQLLVYLKMSWGLFQHLLLQQQTDQL